MFGVRSCAAQSAYVCIAQDVTLNLLDLTLNLQSASWRTSWGATMK